MLVLRTVMSTARVLAMQGRAGEARQGLGLIYGEFTEGSDTADLTSARKLLASFGG
jgi:predicted ATPase